MGDGFFANNADDLEPGAFFDEAKRVELYTPRLLNDGALDDFCQDDLAKSARDGDRSCHDYLRLSAALVLERSEPLPPRLRDFVVDFLRNPNKELKPSPRHRSLIERDRRIVGARFYLSQKSGDFLQLVVRRQKIKTPEHLPHPTRAGKRSKAV